MLPREVACEDCSERAYVRAYGRIEFDSWHDVADLNSGQIATVPRIKAVRLTIDCPRCGVRTQTYQPPADESDHR
jgi:hypothetical protein